VETPEGLIEMNMEWTETDTNFTDYH
jgi:hypothetical protein